MLYSFKITSIAILQIFLLGLCGYILVRRKIASPDNLKFLTHLVIYLFFPCFIFVQLMENFNFSNYSNWWIFPLISFFITISGFITGILFLKFDKGLDKFKKEFTSLVTFQNSGYLPLILIALLFAPGRREQMFVYTFLFLLGFNLIMWSIGVFYLTKKKEEQLELSSLFSPPVIAIIVALILIAVGLNRFIPYTLLKPAKMFGECALPLAIFVVGGNLATINFSLRDNFRYIAYLVAAKLLFLPLVFLGLIMLIRPSYVVSLLILLQTSMPSATSLSIITRHYDSEDNIVSLGIFWTHLLSLLTIPIFLTLLSTLKFFIFD